MSLFFYWEALLLEKDLHGETPQILEMLERYAVIPPFLD